MANDGEWRTPHFQQKWKRGHNENSLWQLLFIHSFVVCSDLGDLPTFCSENFRKTGKWLELLFSTLTLIEQRMKTRNRADVKYNCKQSLIPVCHYEVLTLVL